MSRVPIRVKLTAAFALATAVVLVGAGLFVYSRLRADLDETINDGLRTRASSIAAGGTRAEPDPQDEFAHVIAPGGRDRVLSQPERRAAAHRTLLFDRRAERVEGVARVIARPGRGGRIVVVGRSLQDRDEVLAGLVDAFALGGPVAILLASLLGYGLAAGALGPVEGMRRRAAAVSLSDGSELLPLPEARDEVRALGETLNEMLERLRASFERERRFVGDASHELRTPVAVVKAELEAALRADDLGPAARESLVVAVEECDALAQLAEDLLVLARSADGELPVRREAVDARQLLEGMRSRFADRAAQRSRAIRVEAPAELTVDADPLRLRQALGNLTDNALRHGAGEVVLGARAHGGVIELEVRDGGPGFGALGDSAFERFSRGDPGRTRVGAGLGLAIVRAVAQAHGGRAVLQDGPGGAVTLVLPVSAASQEGGGSSSE